MQPTNLTVTNNSPMPRAPVYVVRCLLLALCAALAVSACRQSGDNAAATGNVLAYVDGEPITAAMVDLFLALRGTRLADAEQRKAALNELIRIQAVVNRAEEQNLLEDNPEIAAELAVNRQRILLNHFSQRFLQERPVTEEELRKAYSATVKRSGQQQIRMDSILYQDEQAAVSALVAAEDGTAFDDLMQQARAAGQAVETLDWIDLSQVPEEYADVIADVEPGAVVPVPLRDQRDGSQAWRVFRLIERRHFQPPAFEEVRPGLERQLRSQKLREWSSRLLSKSEVEMTDGSTFDTGADEADAAGNVANQ